jgi:hypothetical protein
MSLALDSSWYQRACEEELWGLWSVFFSNPSHFSIYPVAAFLQRGGKGHGKKASSEWLSWYVGTSFFNYLFTFQILPPSGSPSQSSSPHPASPSPLRGCPFLPPPHGLILLNYHRVSAVCSSSQPSFHDECKFRETLLPNNYNAYESDLYRGTYIALSKYGRVKRGSKVSPIMTVTHFLPRI